ARPIGTLPGVRRRRGAVSPWIGAPSASHYRSSASQIEEIGWQQYSTARNNGVDSRTLLALEQVSLNHTGSAAAAWADVTWADGKLWLASRQYLMDRAAADASIAEAEQRYKQLAADPAADGVVRNRAKFGLARLNDLRGDLDAAAKLYGEVGGAFAEIAAERAEQLAEESVQIDAEWLASAQATPRMPQFEGQSGLASGATAEPKPDPLGLPEEDATSADSFGAMLSGLKDLGLSGEAGTGDEGTGEADLQPADLEAADDGQSADGGEPEGGTADAGAASDTASGTETPTAEPGETDEASAAAGDSNAGEPAAESVPEVEPEAEPEVLGDE
ncbi:MAG: hypothetical protein AAF790_12785, partial [Planctomycetota bacterium]